MSLLRKKDVAALSEQVSPLKRSLKTHDLVFLGIGAIIGTGIFVLTGKGALTAGPALSLSFLIAAICCGFAGLCYAEFASMAPVSGSAYSYAYISFGELIAFIMGWDLLLEYGLAVSTVAVGWSGYFQSLLANIGIHLPATLSSAAGTTENGVGIFDLPAFVIVLILTYFLAIGINQTKRLNDTMVIIKLVVVILFIVATIWYIKPDNWHPYAPFGWYSFHQDLATGHTLAAGIIPAASIVFFAFIGFDAVSSSAEETINPSKALPRGIMGSLIVCTILYIIMTLIMTGVVNYTVYAQESFLKAPVMAVIQATQQTWLGWIVSLGAIMGITTVMLVMLYGQTRVSYAMSRDGLFPKFLGEVHPKYQTPFKGTWFFGVVCALLAGFVNINILAEMVNIGTLAAFVMVSAGIIWMRKTQPNLRRGFRTPLVPITPLIAIVFCLVLIAGLNWDTWLRFAVWLIIGLFIYFGYSRHHSKLHDQ